MLNGLTSQLMPTVTAMPRHRSATRCSAPKSTFSSIGTIISHISTATGMLTSATVMRPRDWNGSGREASNPNDWLRTRLVAPEFHCGVPR